MLFSSSEQCAFFGAVSGGRPAAREPATALTPQRAATPTATEKTVAAVLPSKDTSLVIQTHPLASATPGSRPTTTYSALSGKWQDAFNHVVFVPGSASPPLYGCVKFIKSLNFDSVSREQTFASTMIKEERRRQHTVFLGRKGHGKDKHIEGLTVNAGVVQPEVRGGRN